MSKPRVVVICLRSLFCNRAQVEFYRTTWSRTRLYWRILQADVSEKNTLLKTQYPREVAKDQPPAAYVVG